MIKDRMRSGALYTDLEECLIAERLQCRTFVYEYNQTQPREDEKRKELLTKLLGSVGKDPYIETPIHFAYGNNTHIGDYFYANFNLVVVDDIEVNIGNHVMFGPNITISVTGHPIHPDSRIHGEQFSYPVTIEDNVWLGSDSTILPGVRIGKNSVIGAGSIVTKDIPANVVAVGNPCRVVRQITSQDKHSS